MTYLYAHELTSPGIRIIVDNLVKLLLKKGHEARVIDSLENVSKNDFVIPYGPKESYEIIKRGYSCQLSLLIDYYSLGCKNKILFYIKHGKCFYKDFLYSIYGYIKYHPLDIKVAKNFMHVALVSQNDIEYLKRDTKISNQILIRNGVNLDRKIYSKSVDCEKLVLGIISNWQFVSIDETRWFIEDIMPKISQTYPNVILKIAGRGDSEKAKQVFSKYPNVEFLGPVDSLDEFFNNLDIYVATVPKGCGILNKVLDAFSYKVFTIGVEESFSGIDGLKNGYIACKSAQDYIDAIALYQKNTTVVNQMIENAYNHISKYHNFENNYEEIANHIITLSKQNSVE